MIRRLLLLMAALLSALAASAQIPVSDPDREFGGRVSVSAGRKLSDNLRIYGQEEVRAAGRMLNYVRSDMTAGATYKISPWLRTSLGYTLLGKVEYRTDWSWRHRADWDMTGTYKSGPWKIALRERLELTHHPGSTNVWQHPRNELDLKSRLKVSYKINKRWRPYAGMELKHSLNAPTLGGYSYNKTMYRYETPYGEVEGPKGWMISGYSRADLLRVRGMAGVEIHRKRAADIRVYALVDWCDELKIDIDHTGTVLKSLVYITGYRTWLGVAWEL